MRALRVVGIDEDGSIILEDSGRHERFTVVADEQLRAAARGDLSRFGQIAIELESQLRPREIQARIRAGASVDQVAAAAGMPAQKIERFAYPVLLERSRTAELAQRAHPVRAEGGPDTRSLGEVVAHTFGLRGHDYTDVEWDSWKSEDGKWVVALSWRAGRSDNRAHWTFHPGAHGGTVTALDEYANDLVEGLPARPLRTVGPVIDMARPEEPTPEGAPEELRAAASDNAVRTAAGMRVDAGRDRSPGRVEHRPVMPPMQRQTEPRPNVESRTAADGRPAADARPPAETRTETRAQETKPAVETSPPERAQTPSGRAPSAQAGAPAATEQAAATPADEQSGTTPPAAPATRRGGRKGKPVMPSWDEVLLGVRGQR